MTVDYLRVIFTLVFTFSVLAVAANLLVILVFAGTRHLRIKYYAFVFNLALADLGFASVASVYPWYNKNSTVEDLLQICSIVNALTVLAVAINRYLALSLMPPSRYDALVKSVRLFIVCVLMWCFAIGVTVPQMLGSTINSFDVFHAVVRSIGEIIVWSITTVVYVLVFFKIKRYAPPLAESPAIDTDVEQNDTRYRQTRRMLVTFSIICAVSLVCWIPADVNILIVFYNQDILQVNWGFRVYYAVALLVYSLNALADPVIYWWRLPGFREAAYGLVCRCFRKDRSNDLNVRSGNEHTITDTAM
ncbi:lysophosphatidic acid receptor 2-like [Acanthaster planci]|uniref:Lysophosphatidic acid receptor 2-like n=1 Tax=Acanthaster planci TaxID=133434 RepID=A0A8B7YKM4_ACAPL|nr:lysophosphatidic acid receptor 2-like [Acanthaster planci]